MREFRPNSLAMSASKQTDNGELSASGLTAGPLPYRKPKLGRDYWIKDDILPNASEVAERCLAKTSWTSGLPWRQETWPGMRSPNALRPDELRRVEDWVRLQTGVSRLWQPLAQSPQVLSHNFAQLVGGEDSGPRPHTDSRKLCQYAGVLYLTPNAPPHTGTSFYRQRRSSGRPGGNTCRPPHNNLSEALGVKALPLDAWLEDLMIPNIFNRLLVYRSDLVHSASAYFGSELESKRLTAIFFWRGC